MTDIIFDLDGTLADCTHRVGFVRVKPPNWPAFEAGIPHDTVIEPVRVLYNCFMYSGNNEIIFASGRGEQCRQDTLDWLNKHGLWVTNRRLYMRAEGDSRTDDIVKAELLDQMRLDGFNPYMVVDDRMSVCRMWAEKGVFCVCVNQGFKEF